MKIQHIDGRSDAEVAREHIGRLLTEIFGATGGTDHWHPENALRKAVLDARAFIATQPAKTGSGNG